MKDLIEALTIMKSKGNVERPCYCEHDELHVYPASMDFTEAEFKRLEELSFFPNDMDGFMSYRFGNC